MVDKPIHVNEFEAYVEAAHLNFNAQFDSQFKVWSINIKLLMMFNMFFVYRCFIMVKIFQYLWGLKRGTSAKTDSPILSPV